MFFEFRLYWTRPGQRQKWVVFMEEVIVPFMESKGMVVIGTILVLA